MARPSGLAALSVPNFRRFLIGQTISLIGSWTETVAQAVLVLSLTHSGLVLGLATAARYAPVLALTPLAGVLADRDDKRRLLLVTQSSLAITSVVLGVLVLSGAIELWMVFVVALVFGTVTAADNPARLTFVSEMVGPSLQRNAITLNSTMVNVGRAVGPIVAATLVATVGVGWCFLANAASFAAVIVSLASLDVARLHPAQRVRRQPHQLRDGLRYARRVPDILAPLCMMVLVGTFTYEFEVSLPLFARGPLGGNATTYSLLIAAFGVGSVIGGLYCMWSPQTGVTRMIRASALYAVAMGATAVVDRAWLAIICLVIVGMASITFLTTGNSTIQISARPEMRGRVTALWSTALVGSTPIGATIIGAIGDAAPRAALLAGAAACVIAAGVGASVIHVHLTSQKENQHDRSL
jgi:MFS family permease